MILASDWLRQWLHCADKITTFPRSIHLCSPGNVDKMIKTVQRENKGPMKKCQDETFYLVFEDSASLSLGLSFGKLNWILVRTWIGLSWHFMYVGKFNSSLLGIFFSSNRKVLWDWGKIKILIKSKRRIEVKARRSRCKTFYFLMQRKAVTMNLIK